MVAALFLCLFGSTCATTASEAIFVRANGNDERSGKSPVRALKTIQHALSVASEGATIIVGPGIYDETLTLKPPKSPKGVSIFADTTGQLAGSVGDVSVEGIECRDMDWLQVIGLTVVGSIQVESVGHVSLRDCAVIKGSDAAVFARQCNSVQLVDSSILDSTGDAIELQSVTNLALTNCTISGNRGTGLKHTRGNRANVSRCRFSKNQTALHLAVPTSVNSCQIVDNQRGIVVAAPHTHIEHATIAFNRSAAIDCGKHRDVGISNSIIAYNGEATTNELRTREEDIISPFLRRNLWFKNGNARRDQELPASELNADPQFVSSAKRDFRLGNGSPARDAATQSSHTIDLSGGPRSIGKQADLGCWESRPKDPQTYFVRTTGNNAASGFEPETAWATLGKAARFAGPGDTVYFEAGVYTKAATIRANGTTQNAVAFVGDTQGKHFSKSGPVIFQLDEGEDSVVAFSYAKHISFTGFQFLSHRHHKTGFGVAVHNCKSLRFDNCEWKGGGTCLSLLGSSASLTDCTFTGAGHHGISLRMSSLEAQNSHVDDCTVGLFIDRDGAAAMEKCRFLNNRTVGVYASGACWVRDSETSRNGTAGTVIYGLDGSQFNTEGLQSNGNGSYGVTFADCAIPPDSSACKAWQVAANPCGILVTSGSVALDEPVIQDSSKVAIHLKDGSLHCGRGDLTCDEAGAIVEETGSIAFQQTLFTGRDAGTAVLANGRQARLTNCVLNRFAVGVSSTTWCSSQVANCTLANVTETAIDLQRGSMELTNTIMMAAPNSGDFGIKTTSLASLTHSHNLIHGFHKAIEGTSLARTESTKSPKFVSLDDGDFHLATGSPAINSGTTVTGVDTKDMDGNARPLHHAFEIGAYEYTSNSGSVRVLKWLEKR